MATVRLRLTSSEDDAAALINRIGALDAAQEGARATGIVLEVEER